MITPSAATTKLAGASIPSFMWKSGSRIVSRT
jgi:hypothetical protein